MDIIKGFFGKHEWLRWLSSFAIAIFIVKYWWSMLVPKLFPSAVEQGLIADELGFGTTLQLLFFLYLFVGLIKFLDNFKEPNNQL